MDRLSEEEIIDKVMMIDQWKVSGDIYTQNELNAIGELLDLYEKEKGENKEIRQWKYVIDTYADLEKLKELDLIKIEGKEYISKDKIRGKIKELEEKIHVVTPDTHIIDKITEFKNEGALNILQELLEEE